MPSYLLTSDIQAVPSPDFALAVQHREAALVRHPDRVQRHPFLRHAETPRVFLRRHRRLVEQHHGWRLCGMMYLSVVGRLNQTRPQRRREGKVNITLTGTQAHNTISAGFSHLIAK